MNGGGLLPISSPFPFKNLLLLLLILLLAFSFSHFQNQIPGRRRIVSFFSLFIPSPSLPSPPNFLTLFLPFPCQTNSIVPASKSEATCVHNTSTLPRFPFTYSTKSVPSANSRLFKVSASLISSHLNERDVKSVHTSFFCFVTLSNCAQRNEKKEIIVYSLSGDNVFGSPTVLF